MGARDMEKPRPPAIDGGSSPLMWHAALQLADYNRNPAALDLMRQWADTWLAFMRPGHWATDIEVATGRVVGVDNRRPLYGGYRSQACVFVWPRKPPVGKVSAPTLPRWCSPIAPII